jgi:uncharacterized coiled-coil protein SlyX
MSSPELVRLAGRVDSQDETLRAVSDTVVEIKETVDQHTRKLAAIQTTLTEQGRKLDALETRISEGFAQILRRLDGR